MKTSDMAAGQLSGFGPEVVGDLVDAVGPSVGLKPVVAEAHLGAEAHEADVCRHVGAATPPCGRRNPSVGARPRKAKLAARLR